jgi:dephospho-CoA kinase
MNEDDQVKAAMQNAFGKEVYPEGKLDRKYLAEIVFKDEEKLELLNSIVHPATLYDAAEWMKQQTSSYAIKEAALIFESGADKSLDYVIGVSSPLPLRIQRAMKRDNLPESAIVARIKRQMDEDEKMKLCDFIITNDEQQMLIPQVLDLHHKIIDLSKVQT